MPASSVLARALVESLDDDALDALAQLLAPRLSAQLGEASSVSPWLDAAGAAEYLSTSRDRLYDLVQLRKLQPSRDGRRLLFRSGDLDAYLEGCK